MYTHYDQAVQLALTVQADLLPYDALTLCSPTTAKHCYKLCDKQLAELQQFEHGTYRRVDCESLAVAVKAAATEQWQLQATQKLRALPPALLHSLPHHLRNAALGDYLKGTATQKEAEHRLLLAPHVARALQVLHKEIAAGGTVNTRMSVHAAEAVYCYAKRKLPQQQHRLATSILHHQHLLHSALQGGAPIVWQFLNTEDRAAWCRVTPQYEQHQDADAVLQEQLREVLTVKGVPLRYLHDIIQNPATQDRLKRYRQGLLHETTTAHALVSFALSSKKQREERVQAAVGKVVDCMSRSKRRRTDSLYKLYQCYIAGSIDLDPEEDLLELNTF